MTTDILERLVDWNNLAHVSLRIEARDEILSLRHQVDEYKAGMLSAISERGKTIDERDEARAAVKRLTEALDDLLPDPTVREIMAGPDTTPTTAAGDVGHKSPTSWMPIETAPKDGTLVYLIALDKDGICEVASPGAMRWSHTQRNGLFPGIVGMWVSPEADFTWQTSDGYGPTHWMPLPEPPKESE